MANNTLSITDNRTGKKYELAIEEGDVIRAADLRQIKVGKDDFGLMSYDPAFTNTASCRSRITYIDGDKGILRYRGYPIEELAEKSNYLETAYLIVKGELPDRAHYERWENNIKIHTMVHENIKKFMEGYRYDAHPMGMLLGTVGALSTFYPDDNELSYTGNLLAMLFKMTEVRYKPDPVLERALDVLFILHADHEQNCSANAMRAVGSSQPDPYACAAAAIAALYGPLHGGANEAAIRMLMEIGSVANVPAMIRKVKEGERRLMGFGHRVYKNYDPRAKILKEMAAQVFAVTRHNPLIDIAIELERIALQDDYFISHKLYPNVDFYSGIIYQAMGFPMTMFPVLFAIPRTSGWMAQWAEMVRDPEQKIARPRQVYIGEGTRHYIPLDSRPVPTQREDAVSEAI
jgi:citrate synthase